MRTILAATALGLLPVGAGALDLVRAFADCTGRYSALMEHRWLMAEAGSERAEARRDHFADLLDAVTDDPVRALAWRIEAKAAQAALFSAAAFGRDPALRRAAGRRADAQIDACDRLLPGV